MWSGIQSLYSTISAVILVFFSIHITEVLLSVIISVLKTLMHIGVTVTITEWQVKEQNRHLDTISSSLTMWHCVIQHQPVCAS